MKSRICPLLVAVVAMILVASPATGSGSGTRDDPDYAPGSLLADSISVVNGTILGVHFKFKDIPKGATVVVKLKGCKGKVVKRVTLKKPGTYRKELVVRDAHKKFGSRVSYVSAIKLPGYKTQRYHKSWLDLRRAQWHCR